MKPKIAEIRSFAAILLPQLGDDRTECSTYIPECVIKAGYLGSDNFHARFPSHEGPLLTVKNTLENGGIQSGK